MRMFATRSTLSALPTLSLLFALLSLPAFDTPASPADAAPAVQPARMTQEQLFKHVESLDRAVFDAFNICDLKKLETFFIPELEFYHDKGGVTWTRERFISDVKNNVCGKFRRELVAGSLEVFPLGDYGAVYSGTHRFCKFGASRCEGIGRFMHIWQNKDGEWRMTRVISYDHRPAP